MSATARPLPASRRRTGVALPVVLWLVGAAISGFTLRRYLIPLDEGILLQAGTRMAGGQWPWRDFGWAYGPGGPLVMAGAFKLLGPSALWWRLLRVAADASAALLVWALVRDAWPSWSLPAWAAAALIAAQPTGPGPAPIAFAFGLGAVLLAARDRPGWAGAAAAAAAFWRPDFGVCAALAAMACAGGAGTGRLGLAAGGGAAARRRRNSSGGPASRRRGEAATGRWPALRVAVVAAGLGAVLYAPFVAVAGPTAVWHDLVAQGARDGGWWRLPFPDGYPGRLRAWPPWTLAGDLKDVAGWLVQYVALAVAAAGAVVAVVRRPRALIGLVVLALGAVAYLISRADDAHAQPLAVLACAIAPLAWAAVAPVPRTTVAALRPRRAPEPRTPTVAAAARAAAAAALALLLAVGAANRLSALVRPPHLVALHLPGVEGIEVPSGEARALPGMVALVDRLVPPGKPIYVAPRRSDLVTRSNPLIHFLVRRPNVLSRDVLLQAKPAEQAAIVAVLRRARPVVVRWTDPASAAPEPNPRGRSSGSRALDDYLAGAYRLRARFGVYDVLVPR